MPDPITERLSQCVAKIVRAVPLEPVPAAVVFRKRPVLLDGDRLPLLIVCVGDGEEFEPLGAWGRDAEGKWLFRWRVVRPVSLALAFASQGQAADNSELRAWRDAIWGAVTQRSLDRAGLPEADDVTPQGEAVFDAAAFQGTNTDWSLLVSRVATLEVRRDA